MWSVGQWKLEEVKLRSGYKKAALNFVQRSYSISFSQALAKKQVGQSCFFFLIGDY